MTEPKTLPEWNSYIHLLTPDELDSKAYAANQVAFVRSLEEDGMTAQDIAGVFVLFAQRFEELNLRVPTNVSGYVNYSDLLGGEGVTLPSSSS